jgi:hypothetical protein
MHSRTCISSHSQVFLKSSYLMPLRMLLMSQLCRRCGQCSSLLQIDMRAAIQSGSSLVYELVFKMLHKTYTTVPAAYTATKVTVRRKGRSIHVPPGFRFEVLTSIPRPAATSTSAKLDPDAHRVSLRPHLRVEPRVWHRSSSGSESWCSGTILCIESAMVTARSTNQLWPFSPARDLSGLDCWGPYTVRQLQDPSLFVGCLLLTANSPSRL